MRSQIIQLSILILLSLTQSSVAVKRCYVVTETTPPETTPSTTSTSTSTTLAPTTTTTAPLPCGALLPYNIATAPNDPSTYGLMSGQYIDGSDIYPGTTNTNCAGQNPSPARIKASSGTQAPGGYASCSSPPLDRIDNVTAKYFVAHSDLKWIPTTGATYSTVPGIIPVQSNILQYVGRINVTLTNGTFTQISKIYNGKIYYNNPTLGNEVVYAGNFDILACSATTTTSSTSTTLAPTTATPTVTATVPSTTAAATTASPPCGTLLPYNIATASPNDPALYGFPSGTFYDNSIIYPGTGNFGASCNGQNPGAARIMTSNGRKGPGAYTPCGGGEQFDNVEAKFFLKHPNLKWVATSATVAAQVPGAIQVIDPYGTFYVGRINVTIGNGTFTEIGKLEAQSIFYYTGADVNSYTYTQGAFEVLACQY